MSFTLIKSLLDYCNVLYVYASQASAAFLQLVQNAAAGLQTGTQKQEQISSELPSICVF